MPAPQRPDAAHSVTRIAIASAIGTAIEWYDFFLYGVVAAIVLNKVFFPEVSPLVGTLLSYTTFAIGFVARPVGGVIFGHFGDRIGRKTILILTLLIMGVSTFLIGLLPGQASIGIAAPILLLVLRILQGIGIGGEWGGAVLMAFEHAGHGRRGFYASFPQLGVPIGLMLSAGVVALLGLLPEADFLAWGWRIAFLLSAVLVAIGLFIRMRILETPDFLEVKATRAEVAVPFLELLRRHPRAVVLTLGARYVEGACFNVFGVFIIAYLVGTLHLARGLALDGVILASAVMIPFILFYGRLGDRFGLRRVFGIGAVAVAITSVLAFIIMQSAGAAHPGLIWLAMIIPFSLAYPAVYGTEAALFATQFSTPVRYSGVSFAYQFSGIFASGLTPIVCTYLLAWGHGNPWLISVYMVVVGLISLVSVIAMHPPLPHGAEEGAASSSPPFPV